jgi:hypothetical protein
VETLLAGAPAPAMDVERVIEVRGAAAVAREAGAMRAAVVATRGSVRAATDDEWPSATDAFDGVPAGSRAEATDDHPSVPHRVAPASTAVRM